MTISELRTRFPATEHGIHLNHAGMGPISTDVVAAVTAVIQDLTLGDGTPSFIAHLKRQTELRATLARMMNAPVEGMALVKNTSHGLTISAQAIPFQPGDNVVVGEIEYPSNVYPWQAQEVRGVSTTLVAARPDGMLAEDDLIAACDEKTRVLAVSWVQWGTGQRMDLAKLGAFCRAQKIWLVVDVVQGFGALAFDAALAQADIATAGCHKWLLAPAGIGALWIRPERLPELLPTNIGWNWVNNPINWDRLRFEDHKPTADRFEEGSPAILATAALKASVDLLESVGTATIEAAVLENATTLHHLLQARGMRVVETMGQSGIVAFNHPTLTNEAVTTALEAARVRTAIRCGYVRLSPHAYNTTDELERAVAAIL